MTTSLPASHRHALTELYSPHEADRTAPGTTSAVSGSAPSGSPSAYAVTSGASSRTLRARYVVTAGWLRWVPL